MILESLRLCWHRKMTKCVSSIPKNNEEGEAKKYIVDTTLPCARLCETQRRELGHVGHTACATDRLYGPHKLVGPFSVKLVRVVFQSAFQCQQYYRLC
ncbi:hypothetical protein E1A91_A04G156800v1 [Gossypium mustelinum]|uniref:Uncharacterized protein n=1 Tax=Gossypium mustelinum TaxID=34275 RepID=A0A5D2ZRN8_GOSMU|nr:hypothetical protein E1A91_A04G156800v1 [Gossypium mustelinum]TYJ40660.1 hypothetical protein E1A91_A04G156800v1 [Gossypium mustelinum]